MIIPAKSVKRLVQSYNWLNITGLKGEGKTRFALEVAKLFMDDGYRLVTNIQTVIADDPEKIQPLSDGTYRVMMLMDEGGWFFRTLETASLTVVESHKMDIFWLCPSVMLPHEELWTLSCYPLFHIGSFYVWKFISLTIQSVTQGKPKVSFAVQIASPVYQNLYKTSAPGYRPEFILSLFQRWIAEFARHHGITSYGLRDLARPDSIHSQGAVGTLSKIAPLLGSSSSDSNRRKGK